MKVSAKPISSPGRTDKFPPPLMRFLMSKAESRSSRGRSRSSPMFVRKKNTAIETTQEPSSPKVTCMGQVRVRRSSKQSAAAKKKRHFAAARDGAPTRCRCWWIRKNPLFCKIKPHNNTCCYCKPVWPKWGFFRVGSFRKKPTKHSEDSTKSESNFHRSNKVSEAEHEEEDSETEYSERVNPHNASASCTPPKNALLLTRCRSAPYRSSSLACRFWGSPLRSEEEGERETGEEEEQGNEPEGREPGSDEPGSKRESVSEQEGKRVSETDAKLGFSKELEDSLRNRVASSVATKSESVEEVKRECEVHHPIMLTRSKSEPARTGHKLDPEGVRDNGGDMKR